MAQTSQSPQAQYQFQLRYSVNSNRGGGDISCTDYRP